jgi:hypothetical protein
MFAAASLALVPALAAAQGGLTKPKQGQGGSVVKGSAGTDGGKDDNGLEHCDKPMGAMAVVEPQSEYMMALSRYNLGSPISLIRMMIQQSNCFIVVERGQGLRNMEQERALAAQDRRSGSNIGGSRNGRFHAASRLQSNAGGVGGAAAGLLEQSGDRGWRVEIQRGADDLARVNGPITVVQPKAAPKLICISVRFLWRRRQRGGYGNTSKRIVAARSWITTQRSSPPCAAIEPRASAP